MARALAEIVEIDGHSCHALRDRFPQNISDIDYFNELGRNWLVVSKDLANSRKKAERTAILRNNIVAFYLSPALQKTSIYHQSAAILWHWDRMVQQRKLVDRGLFQLPQNKAQFKSL